MPVIVAVAAFQGSQVRCLGSTLTVAVRPACFAGVEDIEVGVRRQSSEPAIAPVPPVAIATPVRAIAPAGVMVEVTVATGARPCARLAAG